MIDIIKKEDYLILEYYSKFDHPEWLDNLLESRRKFKIGGVFKFNRDYFLEKKVDDFDETAKYQFRIGDLQGEYYQIYDKPLELENSFHLHKDLNITTDYFIAESHISVLKKIDKNINEPVFIGGKKEDVLPVEDFEKMIKIFPKSYEVNLYRDAKVTSIIGNYFSSTRDRERQYQNYLNKKTLGYKSNLVKAFKEIDIIKYETILERLERMLINEISYTENQWQEEILQIILLLFPKYLAVFKEVKFKDIYNNTTRRLDYGLIDFMGNLDLVEIKIPFEKSFISKVKYRDNHVPNKDLSGAIMQIEKYIYYLNKLGKTGETLLTKKYKEQLPEDLEIKIVNPRGIIIMGRDNEMIKSQLEDFEIIKRKYKNIADIFTYDDLIRRIKLTIKQLRKL